MLAPHNIRDRIAFRSSLQPLKEPAFGVINALQNYDASLQIEALALTLTLLAQSAGLEPHELVSRAKRQAADADSVRNPLIEAIRDYAAGELR